MSCIEQLLSTVADQENTEQTDLPPLYEFIEPEALVKLIDDSKTAVSVRFVYHGYNVEIDGQGRIKVHALADGRR